MGDLHILRPGAYAEYERHWLESYSRAVIDFGGLRPEALRAVREGLSIPRDGLGQMTPGARAYVLATQGALEDLIEEAGQAESEEAGDARAE